jgi:hypothetical protein
MADVTNNIIQTVTVDTSNAVKSVGDLAQQVDSLVSSENKATDAGERFNFTNEEAIAISGRYTESLKELQAAVEANANEITVGMQSATAATQQFAAATQQNQAVFQSANQNMLGSLAQQRIAFTDLGRVVDGQGLSLRNFTSTLGLLGPEGFIVGAALAGIGYALYSLIDTSKSVADALKLVNDQFDKLQARDKYITDSVNEQTELLKSRAKAVGASVDQIAAVEENGARQRIKTAQETLDELNAQQKAATAAFLKDDSDKNKAVIDGLNNSIAKQQDIVKAAQDKLEELQNDAKARDLKNAQELSQRQLEALAGEQAFIIKVKEIGETAEQQQEDALTLDYQKRLAALQKYHLDSTNLTAAYQRGLLAIQDKAGQEEDERDAKAYADHLNRQDKIKQDTQKQVQELQTMEQEYLVSSERSEGERTQAAITAEDAKYNKVVEAAKLTISNQKELDAELEALAKQHAANIAGIEEKGFQEGSKTLSEWFAKDRQIILNNNNVSYQDRLKALDQDKQLLNAAYDTGLLTDQDYTKALEQNSKDRIATRNAELAAYSQIASSLGQINSSIEQMGAQNTIASKALGLAQIAISAGVAIAKATAAASDIPFPGNIAAIAASIATVVADIASAEKLLNSANVPGGGSSGSSSSSSVASLTTSGGGSYSGPVLPSSASVTTLNPNSINQINSQISNGPTRVYVLESDITAAQQRVEGYQQASII